MAEVGAKPARQLSAFDATMLVMGGIIGVGIFFTPQDVAAKVGDPSLFVVLWVLGALVAVCGALTFAEWGATFPRAGGWFVFLREAFSPFAAFLFAWVILGVVTTGAMAIIATFGASQVARLNIGIGAAGTAGHLAVAAGFIVVLTGITLCGIKIGATVQNLCMITKLVAISALVFGGLLFFMPPAEQPAAPVATAPALELGAGLAAAALPVLFSYGGWQNVCYVAPQVVDPGRTLPRAILIGVAGVGIVYVATNLAYLRVLGIDGLIATQDFASEVALRSVGPRFERMLAAVMAVSAFGVCAVNVIVVPGVYVAMAREGLFFRSFGELHARTGAPVLALLLQAALTLVYVLWSHLDAAAAPPTGPKTDGFRMDIGTLTGSVVFAEWIFHGLVAWGLLRIRRTRPELPRPFRSPLWPLAPLAYLLTASLVVFGNLLTALGYQTLIGLGILGLGALVYRPWRAVLDRS